MKVFFRLFLFLPLLIAVCYLLIPSPQFPSAPPESLQSSEPADTESTYRRSYYTNLSRTEVLTYFGGQFYIPGQLLLNYPPEESSTLIRDQTRSSWLQEYVHPLRESIYISGWYPTKPTEQINIAGVHYLNKITVRLIPSHPATRLTVLLFATTAAYLLIKEYAKI